MIPSTEMNECNKHISIAKSSLGSVSSDTYLKSGWYNWFEMPANKLELISNNEKLIRKKIKNTIAT